MNYFTEIATWISQYTFIAYHCVPPLRFPASLGILRWGNASDQKLEVGELRSPASYYTLSTDWPVGRGIDVGRTVTQNHDMSQTDDRQSKVQNKLELIDTPHQFVKRLHHDLVK